MQSSIKGKIVAVLVVFVGIGSGWVHAAWAGYFSVGAGYGGEGENLSVSIETGRQEIDFANLNMLLGVGVPIIPYGGDNLPDYTIDGDCPNDDCVSSGTEYTGTEVGVYAKIGLRFFIESVYLNIIGGGTVVTESTIVKSPTTGRYYEESTESVLHAMYGAGLAYFPEVFSWQLVIQIDADNRRGVSGLVGFFW